MHSLKRKERRVTPVPSTESREGSRKSGQPVAKERNKCPFREGEEEKEGGSLARIIAMRGAWKGRAIPGPTQEKAHEEQYSKEGKKGKKKGQAFPEVPKPQKKGGKMNKDLPTVATRHRQKKRKKKEKPCRPRVHQQ